MNKLNRIELPRLLSALGSISLALDRLFTLVHQEHYWNHITKKLAEEVETESQPRLSYTTMTRTLLPTSQVWQVWLIGRKWMFKEKADDIPWIMWNKKQNWCRSIHVAVTAWENVNVQHALNQRLAKDTAQGTKPWRPHWPVLYLI